MLSFQAFRELALASLRAEHSIRQSPPTLGAKFEPEPSLPILASGCLGLSIWLLKVLLVQGKDKMREVGVQRKEGMGEREITGARNSSGRDLGRE